MPESVVAAAAAAAVAAVVLAEELERLAGSLQRVVVMALAVDLA